MHVLVTGGAGFIGSTLVPLLLEKGHRVTVVDRFFFGEQSLAGALRKHRDRLTLRRLDIRSLARSDFRGVQAVVDLAGISNDPSCELDPELTREINLGGCTRVARLAHDAGVERFVFASSCSIYGHARGEQLTEESPVNPVSLYAQCKASAEERLFSLPGTHTFSPTALRLSTAFGVSARMRFDLAVNTMTLNASVKHKISVDGGGRQWRPFVHVQDIAECITHVLGAPRQKVAGKIFNVGCNGNNLRIADLANRVHAQVEDAEVVMTLTPSDHRDYNVCFDKAARELNYTATRSIDFGIAEVLGALRDGSINPEDRRGYTVRQYVFLAEVERTFQSLSLSGCLLTNPSETPVPAEAVQESISLLGS